MQQENKCQSCEMTLAEAIAHAESHIDDSPCGQNHKQLADWLKELKEIKNMKQFIKFYSKHKEVLEGYIKENNIQFNDAHQMLQLVQYAHSLK